MEYAPHGDFCEMLMNKRLPRDEMVARTYVHQLVQGVEYLHSKGIYHMDLKLDNLLVGENYMLKVSDFDSSFCEDDKEFLGTGSEDYRAPEVKAGACTNPVAADVYSVAIIMFTLVFQSFPYSEEKKIRGYNLYDTMINNPSKYWEALAGVHGKKLVGAADFNAMFMSMVKRDPTKRATLDDLKKSAWYNGPVYNKKEMKAIMSKMYAPASAASTKQWAKLSMSMKWYRKEQVEEE